MGHLIKYTIIFYFLIIKLIVVVFIILKASLNIMIYYPEYHSIPGILT